MIIAGYMLAMCQYRRDEQRRLTPGNTPVRRRGGSQMSQVGQFKKKQQTIAITILCSHWYSLLRTSVDCAQGFKPRVKAPSSARNVCLHITDPRNQIWPGRGPNQDPVTCRADVLSIRPRRPARLVNLFMLLVHVHGTHIDWKQGVNFSVRKFWTPEKHKITEKSANFSQFISFLRYLN